ncbi:HD-GYP domain-containing protein [Fervidobacterium pennivorans]|uniref:HD-GYP domain-containing protein n=1 Tax=Fervidobacterium pennivorans TaxID=93466 RepID=UPI00201B47C9|nr:HD domain-containing phosphohydrolase [Fervidobacterium pennivorans]
MEKTKKIGGVKLKSSSELIIELSNTKFFLKNDGTFRISGSLPTQDEIYELAMNYSLPINEKLFDMVYELLKAEDLTSVKKKVENFFKSKLHKDVKVIYSEEGSLMDIQNNYASLPIVSKNSGDLGMITLQGSLMLDEVLGLLAFYDSFVSIVEGIIINYRLEQLLKSSLDTLFVALNKRVRLNKSDLDRMEAIALKIAQLEQLSQEEVRLALRIANVGFVGLRDELFERIFTGDFTNEDYREFLKHVDFGYEILKEMDVPHFILDACVYHHEFVDRSGITGLKGYEIPKIALAVGFAEHVVILKWDVSRLQGKYPDSYLAVIDSRGELQ